MQSDHFSQGDEAIFTEPKCGRFKVRVSKKITNPHGVVLILVILQVENSVFSDWPSVGTELPIVETQDGSPAWSLEVVSQSTVSLRPARPWVTWFHELLLCLSRPDSI